MGAAEADEVVSTRPTVAIAAGAVAWKYMVRLRIGRD
jgi:hypothetical protein